MREKKMQTIVAFTSTSQAMAAELFFKEQKIQGRLIPVPKEVEAGCGLAFLCKDFSVEEVETFLNKNAISFRSVVEILH